MQQALGKAEVERLLSEIQDGSVELEVGDEDSDNFARYDFSKPHSLSRTFENNLATIGDTFAKACAINLSNYYRSTVSVELAGIRHVLFQEYLKTVQKPSCLAIINVQPLRGQSLFYVTPNLIFALVDKLLGGEGKSLKELRDFTEIEIKISHRIISKVLTDLEDSMERFVELNASVSRIENNPEFVNICPGLERVVSLDFNVVMGENEEMLSICIPVAAFEPVIDRFDPVEEIPERTPQEKMQDVQNITEVVKEVMLDLNVVIGEKDVPLSVVHNLKVGDVVVLDRKVNEPVDVLVEGVTKFLAIPGRSSGRKAVKIVKTVREE